MKFSTYSSKELKGGEYWEINYDLNAITTLKQANLQRSSNLTHPHLLAIYLCMVSHRAEVQYIPEEKKSSYN